MTSDTTEPALGSLTEFEWDDAKSDANLNKHGFDFEDARRVFSTFTIRRPARRQDGEQRWIAIGELDRREIAVIYTMRGDVARIISVRRARSDERRAYRQAIAGRPPQGQD
jgi:uncharacterized protein